jgi:hypothetical protein
MDRSVAETSTRKGVTFTKDRHYCAPSGIRTRNPSRREAPDSSLDRAIDIVCSKDLRTLKTLRGKNTEF